ncbi:hypothetical protein [Streptomyces liliifuscus]|uniref:Uncharacterized protein n=1 Tax=Streptomyces liliifuscus TaxID=2797636 RepID=A0A7T7I119_9ACTN|nr:hypothetical protein [Streptomyces liliifuscus]QQM39070.1 hypothetical protein JEQ17_06030 [Streptomyces liliifuscus]
MSASPLPRTACAPTARTARVTLSNPTARTGAAALTALALAGTALLGAGAPAAFAAPGDNGDVKIHAATTPDADQRNNPKVCQFYLAAFNFDRGQGVTWIIEPQPAKRGSATLTGTLALPTGTGRTTGLLALPDGQYKLTWQIVDGKGAGKHKVFKVDCKTPPAGGPEGAAPGGPNGGVPAGGGGLAEPPSVSAVGAAAALGLVGVSGFVYFRMLRRRPDGAA